MKHKATRLPNVVRQFYRGKREAVTPSANGWIRRVGVDTIEFCSREPGSKGWPFALLMLPIVIFIGLSVMTWRLTTDYAPTIFVALLPAYLLLIAVRLELSLRPWVRVLFDRKTQRVLRTFQRERFSPLGLLSRWPEKVYAFSWQAMRAHHQVETAAPDHTKYRHQLVLLAPAHDDYPALAEGLVVNELVAAHEDVTISRIWEHIRRFMEESGPPLPSGEIANETSPRPNFWTCLKQVAPIGSSYLPALRERPVLTAIAHLLLPLAAPYYLLWGVFNWWGHRSPADVDWSQAIFVEHEPDFRLAQNGTAAERTAGASVPATRDATAIDAAHITTETRDLYTNRWRMRAMDSMLEIAFDTPPQSVAKYRRKYIILGSIVCAYLAYVGVITDGFTNRAAWVLIAPPALILLFVRPDSTFTPNRLTINERKKTITFDGWSKGKRETLEWPIATISHVWYRLPKHSKYGTTPGAICLYRATYDDMQQFVGPGHKWEELLTALRERLPNTADTSPWAGL